MTRNARLALLLVNAFALVLLVVGMLVGHFLVRFSWNERTRMLTRAGVIDHRAFDEFVRGRQEPGLRFADWAAQDHARAFAAAILGAALLAIANILILASGRRGLSPKADETADAPPEPADRTHAAGDSDGRQE